MSKLMETNVSEELLISTEKTKNISSDIMDKIEEVNRGSKTQLDLMQNRQMGILSRLQVLLRNN